MTPRHAREGGFATLGALLVLFVLATLIGSTLALIRHHDTLLSRMRMEERAVAALDLAIARLQAGFADGELAPAPYAAILKRDLSDAGDSNDGARFRVECSGPDGRVRTTFELVMSPDRSAVRSVRKIASDS